MRDITLNLTPDLQVSSIERPELDEDFLESIYEDIQFSSVQLMHALQENVLDKETVSLIIEYLSSDSTKACKARATGVSRIQLRFRFDDC